MSKELPFIVLALEEYRKSKNLNEEEVIELFKKNYVFEYLKSFYDVLHITGTKYIIQDIDEYIASRK